MVSDINDRPAKIVTIFLPFLIDGNYLYGKQKLFIDNYTWVERTLDIIKKLKNVNWIIKEHPMERRISSSIDLPSMLKDLENKYRHIRLFSENFDPASLIKFTSVVITHHSSAGIEYSSFGIPCVVAENAFYTNWEFPLKPKNVFEYKNLLKRVHKIGKLNKQKIEESKV